MAAESALRRRVTTLLTSAGAHVTNHEDAVNLGVPDMSYGLRGVNGWIELKQLAGPPKRPTTALRIRHYTSQQRDWLLRRGRVSGNAHLLVEVGREALLFGHYGAQLVGNLNMSDLRSISQYRGRIHPTIIEILLNGSDDKDLVHLFLETARCTATT